MKFSTSDLKNFDFKQFAIDHGEKVVVGLVGLFVVYALFSVRWLPFSRTPDEMKQIAKDATTQLEANTWPEAARKEYLNEPDVNTRADALLQPVQASKYAFTVPPYRPIIEPKQKYEEPKWLPPEHPLATAGRVPLLLPAKQLAVVAAPVDEKKAKPDESDIPAEFKTRDEQVTGAPKTGAKFGKGFSKGDTDKGLRSEERGEFGKTMKRRGRDKEDDNKGKKRVREAANARGRGQRFVSVRAVIPIARQNLAVRRAWHEQLLARTTTAVQLLDFELERQHLNSNGTWGEWLPVNREEARKVLQEADGLDMEILNPTIVDPAVTMPLPPRSAGLWGKSVASHPDVENFELSPEQIDLYMDLQERIIRAKEERESATKKDDKDKLEEVAPGGWSDMVENMRSVGRELQSEAGATKDGNKLQDVVTEFKSDDPEKKKEALLAQLRDTITVEGNLILFRYFDFAVNPGQAYRYRVQVIFNNPSYGLGLDQVVGPDVSTGAKRPSGWSEATNPVIVPGDSKFFLTEVTKKPGKEPLANIDLFQWYADVGTLINEDLPIALGQFVGDNVKTEVLDPARYLYEERMVPFRTNDVLVDVLENPPLNIDEHPDLKFTKPVRRLDINSQALVMDEFGQFSALDPVSMEEDHQREKKMMGYQKQQFKDLIAMEEERKKAEKDEKLNAGKKGAGRGDDDGGRGRSFKQKRNPLGKTGGLGKRKD